MNTPFILDACSLIAFLNAERGGERVKILFEDTGNRIYMHLVNLCEVYYGFYKMDGEERADAVLENHNPNESEEMVAQASSLHIIEFKSRQDACATKYFC